MLLAHHASHGIDNRHHKTLRSCDRLYDGCRGTHFVSLDDLDPIPEIEVSAHDRLNGIAFESVCRQDDSRYQWTARGCRSRAGGTGWRWTMGLCGALASCRYHRYQKEPNKQSAM